MGFVGNYAPCGLSPQMYDMPVILIGRGVTVRVAPLSPFQRCHSKESHKKDRRLALNMKELAPAGEE